MSTLEADTAIAVDDLREVRATDADDPSRTAKVKKAARSIVLLRRHFLTTDGLTDWGGKSFAYRKLVGEVYSRAGWSVEDKRAKAPSIRWHVRSVLREVAPADELEALGLETDPAAVDARRRADRSQIIGAARHGHAVDPLSPLLAVTVASRTLEAARPVEPADRTSEFDAAVLRLADLVAGMVSPEADAS